MEAVVYGIKVEYSDQNPALSYLRRNYLPYIEVKALIRNEKQVFREKIKVSNLEVAEQQIKEVMDFYNQTLQHGELEREFVELWLEDEEVSTYEDDEGMIGWLDPKGNFFPCQFGEHVLYANQLLQRIRKEDIDTLAENQHIPMSIDEKSNYEHIGILSDITPEQVDWFNRFFDKLSRMQKSAVMSALEKQGEKLEFAW